MKIFNAYSSVFENWAEKRGIIVYALLCLLLTSVVGLCYSLDGAATVTVPTNTTLTGLAEDSHTLTVYAGNTLKSETVTFTVATSPTSQLTAVIIVVSVAAVCVGLLFYFKKRKR